jgi:hypothetical protein
MRALTSHDPCEPGTNTTHVRRKPIPAPREGRIGATLASRIALRVAVGLAALVMSQAAAAQTMVPWLTRARDNARSGWNPNETVLSQKSVATRGIIRSTTIPVYGDARGMEAQPLILPNVKLPDGSKHDVMVLPSMANIVRGVDAHSGVELWKNVPTLGTPVTGNTPTGPRKPRPDGCVGDFPTIDCHGINDKWGVLSTGVIDPDTQRLYLVAWVSPDRTPQNAKHFVFVLNVADGSQVAPPVLVDAKSGTQSYSGTMRKQRSSLVLTNVNGRKTVFWASGTVQESGNKAAGWIFAFDCATNSIATALAMSEGEGAGIWMGGQGLVADQQGFLYAITSNGDFDADKQWGESFIKVQYSPAAGGSKASLKVVDHWTPWTDWARAGQAKLPAAERATKLAGASAPSEALKAVVGSGMMHMSLKGAKLQADVDERGTPVLRVYPQAMANGAWSDEDWGSAGPACIFALGVCVATGKDGIGYPIKAANMGGTTVKDLADPKANCAKLAAPPTYLTMSPGPVDPCPPDPMTLNFFPWGDSAHLHMTPVQYFDPVLKSWTLFVWGENAQLHKWAVSSTGALKYIAQSNEYASADVRGNPPGGMPGGFCTGSSNGADPNSALLVCTIPYGDANMNLVNGRLLVYDAVHLAADGSLKVLWDSQRWGWSFLFNKFDPPVIDGGQIFVANYSGGVDVYKLVP